MVIVKRLLLFDARGFSHPQSSSSVVVREAMNYGLELKRDLYQDSSMVQKSYPLSYPLSLEVSE